VTPQYLSVGHFLKELILAETAEVSAWDVNAADFHLIDVKLLHDPHSPVDHLISRPEQGVYRESHNQLSPY